MLKNAKKRERLVAPPTKVVIRHLPSGLSKEEFVEAINPLPSHNWFEYLSADTSLGRYGNCRAYINFTNPDDIYRFRDQFDGYVFLDQKGNDCAAIVEYAPFQKVAHRDHSPKRKDVRMGTINDDTDYIEFLNSIENPEPVKTLNTEKMLEEILTQEQEMKANLAKMKTPLVEFIEQRRADILLKVDRKPHYDFMSTKQLDRIRIREDIKEQKKLRRQERKKLKIDNRFLRRKGIRRTDLMEEELEDDYEDVDEEDPTVSSKVTLERVVENKENARPDRRKTRAQEAENRKEDKYNRREREDRNRRQDEKNKDSKRIATINSASDKRRTDVSKTEEYRGKKYSLFRSRIDEKRNTENKEIIEIFAEDNDARCNEIKQEVKETDYKDGNNKRETENKSPVENIEEISADNNDECNKNSNKSEESEITAGNTKTSSDSAAKLASNDNNTQKSYEDLELHEDQDPLIKSNVSTSNETKNKDITSDSDETFKTTIKLKSCSASSDDILDDKREESCPEDTTVAKPSTAAEEGVDDHSDVAQVTAIEADQQEKTKDVRRETTANDTDEEEKTKDVRRERTANEADEEEKTKDVRRERTANEADEEEKTKDVRRERTANEADEEEKTKDVRRERTANEADEEEKAKELRRERKIRNKDRPAMQLYRPGQTRLASRLKSDSISSPKCDGSSGGSSVASGGGGGAGGGGGGAGGGSSNSSTPSPVMPDEEKEDCNSEINQNLTSENAAPNSSISTSSIASAPKAMSFRRSNTLDSATVKSKDKDSMKRYGRSHEFDDKRNNRHRGKDWTDDYQTDDTRNYAKKNTKYDKPIPAKNNSRFSKGSRPDHPASKLPSRNDHDRKYQPNKRDEFRSNPLDGDSASSYNPTESSGGNESKTGVSGKRYSRARINKTAGSSNLSPSSSLVLPSTLYES